MDTTDGIIYLKKHEETVNTTIISILSFGALCAYYFFRHIERGSSRLSGKDFLVFALVCIFIFIMRLVLTSNYYTIYMDTLKKEIVFAEGKKQKVVAKIRYDKIKNIVIVNNSGKYAVDIYDNELNAYECFDDKSYGAVFSAASTMERILKIKLEDKSDEQYYQGYLQRKI